MNTSNLKINVNPTSKILHAVDIINARDYIARLFDNIKDEDETAYMHYRVEHMIRYNFNENYQFDYNMEIDANETGGMDIELDIN